MKETLATYGITFFVAPLFRQEPIDKFYVAELRRLRFEVLDFTEGLVNGFDLFGVEFVSGVVYQQRRERRDRDGGREIAGAADAGNAHALYKSLVLRRI